MSTTEIAPSEVRSVAAAHTDVPLARLHHELQCAAREAVGDAVSRPSGDAITELIVALDELLRFEVGMVARGHSSFATDLLARHEELRAACREPALAPRSKWDLSGWALGLRHLLLAHIDASSGIQRRV